MPDDPHILNYAAPPPRARIRFADVAIMVARFAVAVVLPSILALALLCVRGTWYFRQHPTWVFSLEESGTYIGPSGSPFFIGSGLSLFIKLILVAIPVWIAWQFLPRRKRG